MSKVIVTLHYNILFRNNKFYTCILKLNLLMWPKTCFKCDQHYLVEVFVFLYKYSAGMLINVIALILRVNYCILWYSHRNYLSPIDQRSGTHYVMTITGQGYVWINQGKVKVRPPWVNIGGRIGGYAGNVRWNFKMSKSKTTGLQQKRCTSGYVLPVLNAYTRLFGKPL